MTRLLLALLLAAAALGVAAPALPQTATAAGPRVTGGLFGGGRPSGPQSLDLSVDSFGGYDTNVAEDDPTSILDPRTRQSGSFSGMNTKLAYGRRFRRVRFGLSEESALRYYGSGSDILGLQHAVGAGIDIQLAHTNINVSQSLAFVPFYSFTTLPPLFATGVGVPASPNPDESIARRDEWLYSTFVPATRTFGDRLSATVSGSVQGADFVADSTGMRTLSGAGRLTYGLTKGLGLVAGYGVTEAAYHDPQQGRHHVQNHNIEAGLTFDRPLSLTRRTTLGLTIGTAATQDESRVTQYRAVADARLNRDIARTWHATAAYHRGLAFVDGFMDPFFTDSLNLSVGGLLGSRVEVTTNAGYSVGDIGSYTTTTRSESYSGSARLQIALSQRVALTAQYLQYRYRFGQADLLPQNMPPRLERQGLRVGLDVWLPLVR